MPLLMEEIAVRADDEDASSHEERLGEFVALVEEGTARLRQRDDLEKGLMLIQIVVQCCRIAGPVIEDEYLDPAVRDF